MLRITVDAGKTTIAMSGKIIEIVAEASIAVEAIYERIEEKTGEEMAFIFKYLLQAALTDKDSPLMREKKTEKVDEDEKLD